MKSLSIYITVFAIILLTSCVKEYDETIPTPGEIEEPQKIINSDLTGQIMISNRFLLEDATIHIGNKTTTSNEYGWFKLEDVPMDANGQIIKITKEGYFPQYKLIYPEVNKNPYISAQLLPKTQTGSFQSENGGEIIGDKLKIDFCG